MVGRNDLCPCGSGRKNKQCCLATKQVVSLHAVRMNRAYNGLLRELANFANSLPGDDRLRAEMQFLGHLNPRETPEFPAGTEDSFLDWFCFNYRQWESNETPLQTLSASREFTEIERELLDAWLKTHPRFYRASGVSASGATLTDLITGVDYTFRCAPYEPPAEGTIAMGRILPVGNLFRPSFDLVTGSDNYVEPLLSILPIELERMRRAHPNSTLDDLFRERWPLIRSLTVHSAVAANNGVLPKLNPILPNPSLGVTTPPPGCPQTWTRTYDLISRYFEPMELPTAEMMGIYRLCWDALTAINPPALRPATWGAAIAYTWHEVVAEHEGLSARTIGQMFGVGEQTLVARSQEINNTLQVLPYDDRYMDILDSHAQMTIINRYYPLHDKPTTDDLNPVHELTNQAEDLIFNGQFSEAQQLLTQALEIQPSFVPAQFNLAVIHQLNGDTKGAIAIAEGALQQTPAYLPCLALLAQSYFKIHQRQVAQGYLMKAAESFQAQYSEVADEPYADRQILWAAIVALGEDALLVNVALKSRISRADPRAITTAAIAADRIGDRSRAKAWLKLAQSKASDWTLPQSLLAAIHKMEQGWVPSFKLDYELTPASLAPDDWEQFPAGKTPGKATGRKARRFPVQRLDSTARAILMEMIWGSDQKTALSALEVAVHQVDPWLPEMLRAALTRPEIADRLKPKIIGALVEMGNVKPGDELMVCMKGVLQPGQVSTAKTLDRRQ